MPVNQTLSIYLPRDLADRVDAAKEAGLFEPKEVCKTALEHALNPNLVPIVDASELYTGGSVETAFQVQYANTSIELQATLDNIVANGGYPQSLAVTPDAKYALLVAWPKGTN